MLGADVTYIDLANYNIPLYNEDDEAKNGLPPDAKKLKEMMIASDGMIIASPEYNGAPSAVLKNVIDWVSRPEESDLFPLVALKGKVIGIMSTSPSPLGGIRGLVQLRMTLGNVGAIVSPQQVSIPNGLDAFSKNDSLIDPNNQKHVNQFVKELVSLTEKIQS